MSADTKVNIDHSGSVKTSTPKMAGTKPTYGPVVGAVIVIAILLYGGLFYYKEVLAQKPEPAPILPGDEVQTTVTPLE